MNSLGLDPGLNGALALLDPDGKVLSLLDMPTLKTTKTRRILDPSRLIEELVDYQRHHGPLRAIVEQVIVLPKQGASSGFKTGVGFGQVLGILAGLDIPHEVVAAQRWQRAVLGKVEKGTAKDRARAKAQQLWPSADLGKRKSQDRSDALLLAWYGLGRRG